VRPLPPPVVRGAGQVHGPDGERSDSWGEPGRERLRLGVLNALATLESNLLALEAAVRQAHGLGASQIPGRPKRDRDGTGFDPRVLPAATWLRTIVGTLDDDWAGARVVSTQVT
jgi:hypothetical protein